MGNASIVLVAVRTSLGSLTVAVGVTEIPTSELLELGATLSAVAVEGAGVAVAGALVAVGWDVAVASVSVGVAVSVETEVGVAS